MSDSYAAIPFDVLVDSSTGSLPMPEHPTYGSTRHVPNSAIDLTQYTGVGPATISYDIRLARADYDALVALFAAVPRVAAALVVDGAMGDWFLESITGASLLLDGSVRCAVAFRESV
jgi:hypothetical protein